MKKKHRLTRITPRSAAVVLAIVYGALGLIGAIIFGVAAVSGVPDVPGGGGPALLVMPPLYAIVGFLLGGIGAAIYNLAATAVGGIEFETSDD
jgi:hypothetical protein